MNTTPLQQYILEGKFEKALELSESIEISQLRDELIQAAFETESIACYGFCVALIAKKPGATAHGLAGEILGTTSLCQLPGGYQTAYFHAKQAALLDPDNIGNQEFLLFFYGNPEKLITREEAVEIANKILEKDPANEAALHVLKP